MFSFTHTGGTPSSIDPDEERKAPPEATLVFFPQNNIDIQASEDWIRHPPNLFRDFSRLNKPTDVRAAHLSALNFTVRDDVELDDFVPNDPSGPAHLPPASWTQNLDTVSRRTSLPVVDTQNKHLILSNGSKAPDIETFVKYARELGCNTEDGLRAIAHRKPRKGHATPHINHYREFWQKLELISQYWDTELDTYYDTDGSAPPSPTTPKGLRKMSLFMTDKNSASNSKKGEAGRKYRGFRKSTGSKMPDQHRVDMVRTFLRVIVGSFHCQLAGPKNTPQVEIKRLMIPVTQSNIVWRFPEDKNQVKRGVVEGPVMGIQCRADVKFFGDAALSTLDLAREMAGILLLAQERAREGKTKQVPGQGKWYTTRRRWGGGPGGEFGEAEGNTDSNHQFSPTTRRVNVPGQLPRKMTEEEIWKELKPNNGLWEPRTSYLAVGKDRNIPQDSVFMISSIFHHISILKLEVHPVYIEYTLSGQKPPFKHPDKSWYRPVLSRTRWFDMLAPEDRLEAFRGIWGVMSYLMRSDSMAPRPQTQRQQSEALPLFGALRRKSHVPAPAAATSQRSHSVAF